MTDNRYSKLTPQQKNKYYGEDRNRRRRERYAQDNEYRSKVLNGNRDSYYSRTGREARAIPTRKSLKRFVVSKNVRRLTKGPLLGDLRVIRRLDLVGCLHISTTTISRWVREGLFPDAELYEYLREDDGSIKTLTRNGHYTEEEAAALLQVYAEHVRNHGRYTPEHVETKDKFFSAIQEIRKDWVK